MTAYGLYGATSRTLLSQDGLVIAHDNAAELAYLFPACRVVPIPPSETARVPLGMVRGMEPVRFPLNRKDFR